MNITDEMVKAAVEAWMQCAGGHRSKMKAALSASKPEIKGVDIPRLPVGTAVAKVGGYPFPGTVVSAFHTLSGQERFVVEATGEDYRGMLHIFNGGQLRALENET